MSRSLTGFGGGRDRRDFNSASGLSRRTGAVSRFATPEELASDKWRWQQGEPTLLLGRAGERLVGLRRDDRHMLTVAGSRGGKGVSLVIPNLILWPGSALVLDPKGELARTTARARRARGQDVVVLDPFGISGQTGGSCNLLDQIDFASPRYLADLALLGESLIAGTSGSDGDHWINGGRELWTALCIYAKVYHTRPTLVTVRDLLSGKYGSVLGSLDRPSDVFGAMLESDALGGALRGLAISWLEIPDREQGSILSSARRQTHWLEGLSNPDAAMTRVCASSDFQLADLKRRPVTVYLCIPASDMHSYRGWLRAFVNMAMGALERTRTAPGTPPVLLLLDEFATLGYMPSLEKAAGLLAGAGVKLWPIIQDLGQLEAIYGRRWGTFIGNAGVTTWFSLGGDPMTAEYVSSRLGMTQYYEQQEPGGAFVDRVRAGHLTGPGQWITAPLLYPNEVERAFARDTGRLLALSPGWPPAVINRVDIRDGFLKEWVDG